MNKSWINDRKVQRKTCYSCKRDILTFDPGYNPGYDWSSAVSGPPHLCTSCGTAFCTTCYVNIKGYICPNCRKTL